MTRENNGSQVNMSVFIIEYNSKGQTWGVSFKKLSFSKQEPTSLRGVKTNTFVGGVYGEKRRFPSKTLVVDL